MDKFVYFDRRDYCYKDIEGKYIANPDKLIGYFGYIDGNLDDKEELTIYKLVPYKTLKKDTSFKFKEDDSRKPEK